MTAPDPLAETPKIALAERGPSIHDGVDVRCDMIDFMESLY
jgi:hypothetical protein